MAKIGLIDVDSHNFPNLALMKLSAYHKSLGDSVEWWNGFYEYDVVYKARVFDDTYSQDEETCIRADQIVCGGTGYDLQNKLPHDVEHQYPDYSLYGVKKTAYGFLTRGCPRACPFCIVSEKEGRKVEQVAELGEFWRGQKEIVLMDSNITASKECVKLFKSLVDSKSWVNFEGGLDIRFMDDEKANLINQMKVKVIHFAWDNYEFNTYEKLKYFRPILTTSVRDTAVYVLTNFNTTHEEDLERVYKLKELGYNPFVMIFDKPNSPKITRQLGRWVNNKRLWWKIDTFEEYKSSGKNIHVEQERM